MRLFSLTSVIDIVKLYSMSDIWLVLYQYIILLLSVLLVWLSSFGIFVVESPKISRITKNDSPYFFNFSWTSCVHIILTSLSDFLLSAPSTAAIVPTIISVKHDATATFTCTVGGYPIKSVKISGPNSLDLDCISSQSSGDVTCSSTDRKKYVVNVQNFELSDAGNYRCTVETEWYKSSSSAMTTSAHDEVTLSFGNE